MLLLKGDTSTKSETKLLRRERSSHGVARWATDKCTKVDVILGHLSLPCTILVCVVHESSMYSGVCRTW